jgi:hypothetical protein
MTELAKVFGLFKPQNVYQNPFTKAFEEYYRKVKIMPWCQFYDNDHHFTPSHWPPHDTARSKRPVWIDFFSDK